MTRKTNLKKTFGRIFSVFLAVLLMLGAATPAMDQGVFGAVSFSDTYGHWAEGYIKDAVKQGVVNGYPDGTFKPDKPVTRAEFISMVNKALGNDSSAPINFTDVPYNEWFYTDIGKAVAAAYVSGYNNVEFRPNNSITREEAAVIISRIVPCYGYTGNLKSFKDAKSISDWAAVAFQKSNGKGYLGAYDDGRLHPQDSLTRAQTAKIICGIVSGENIVSSREIVKKSSAKLSNTIYSNGVTISKDLGENSATIDNCVVLGGLNVEGGGPDTVTLSNSRVAQCTVDKKPSSTVRLLATGETVICDTYAGEICKIEVSKLSGGLYGTGFGNINVKGSADLTLKGDFPQITLVGSSAILRFQSGKINTLNIERNCRNSEINMDSGATVETANVNGPSTAFMGKGIVNNMIVNTSGVTYETKPKTWSLGSDGSSPTYSEATLTLSYSPRDGAKSVALNTKITLNFNFAVTDTDGKKLSTSTIADRVRIHRRSTSGTDVPFSADISSNKKTITLTPKTSLDTDTKYYVTIQRDTFKGENGEVLSAQSMYFITGDSSNYDVTFSPRNGETGVSLNESPTLFFSEAMQTYAGKTLTDSYLESSIDFRETSASGSKVAFTASYNNAKTKMYIYPKAALKENQKYYVGIPDKIFKTIDSEVTLPACSAIWTTTYTSPSISSLTVSSTQDSVSAAVTPNMAGTVYAVLLGSGTKAPSSDQVMAGKDGNGAAALGAKSVAATAGQAVQIGTFTGLPPSTGYNVYAVIKAASATSSVAGKTVSTLAPLIPPAALTKLSVSNATTFTPGFSPGITGYNVRMPMGTTTADILVEAGADTKIMYGTTLITNGLISVTNIPGTSDTVVSVTAFGDGKKNTVYDLHISVAGDPGVESVTAMPSTSTSNAGKNILVPNATSSVTVTIKAKDPSATVTCAQLTGTSGGTGSLTGTLNLSSNSTVLDFTITSNRDSLNNRDYTINIADPPTTPGNITP